MIQLKVNELLKKQKKTKYWFVKNMEGGYQSLSNLLNNAIEASEQCENPIIKMKFVKEEHQIVLSVANTFSVTPVIVGKRYITTKTKEADRHGIGLENIKETVEKYDGSCVIKHDKNNFKVAILIHNQEK